MHTHTHTHSHTLTHSHCTHTHTHTHTHLSLSLSGSHTHKKRSIHLYPALICTEEEKKTERKRERREERRRHGHPQQDQSYGFLQVLKQIRLPFSPSPSVLHHFLSVHRFPSPLYHAPIHPRKGISFRSTDSVRSSTFLLMYRERHCINSIQEV